MGIRNLSPSLFTLHFLYELNLENNNLSILPSDISKLKNLEILNINSNEITVLPASLGKLVNLRELCFNDNSVSVIPLELGSLYNLEKCAMDGNPLIEPFAGLFYQHGWQGVLAMCRDNNHGYSVPRDRLWIKKDETWKDRVVYKKSENDEEEEKIYKENRNEKNLPYSFRSSRIQDVDPDNHYENSTMYSNKQNENMNAFTVGSYNILGETYATPQHFGYVPQWALKWDNRKDLILNEIINYSFDILCLQEVETHTFVSFFREQLDLRLDYESVFYPKTRAKTMTQGSNNVDGCATFWKKHKFNLLEQRFVEFTQLILNDKRFNENPDIINRNMNKDNIALVTVLEKKKDSIFIVVNAHITWDPDVKLMQSIILVEEILKIRSKYNSAGVFIVGDYNSLHDSGVYSMLASGRLEPYCPDFSLFNYAPFSTTGFKHDLNLKDSYSNGALEFTNFTPTFTGIIDYIFYSEKIEQLAVLGNVDEEYAARLVGLPSVHLPSDHVIIGGKYSYKKNKK